MGAKQVVELETAGAVQIAAEREKMSVVSSSPSKRFRKICVFCGSSSGKKGVFSNEALNLGRELVNRKIDLVYGGGSIGLMGQVAHTVKSGGGHVVGVIPKALIGAELTGSTVGELIAVSDMHQRKAEMARQADAFIALPGGYGTLEELVEVITWNQLGIHKKPVGLLNVDGFYDTLLTFFDKQLEEEFFDNSARSIVVSAPTASELLDKLEAYTSAAYGPKLCWEVERRPCGLGYSTNPIAGVACNYPIFDPPEPALLSQQIPLFLPNRFVELFSVNDPAPKTS